MKKKLLLLLVCFGIGCSNNADLTELDNSSTDSHDETIEEKESKEEYTSYDSSIIGHKYNGFNEATVEVSSLWGYCNAYSDSYHFAIIPDDTHKNACTLTIIMADRENITDEVSATKELIKRANSNELVAGKEIRELAFTTIDGSMAGYSERKEDKKITFTVAVPLSGRLLIIASSITDYDTKTEEAMRRDFYEMASSIKIKDEYKIDFSKDVITQDMLEDGTDFQSTVDRLLSNIWTPLETLMYAEVKPIVNDDTEETTVAEQPQQTPSTTNDTPAASYTSNPKETYKNGNSGIYSYIYKSPAYSTYMIIDFDEGFVYRFDDGNGSETCDRIKILKGDLNSTLIIEYHDGDDSWQEAMYFKWKNQPDRLVYQDSGYYELNFVTTNLDKAIKLRNKRKVIEY